MIKNFFFYLHRGDDFEKAFRLAFGITIIDLLIALNILLLIFIAMVIAYKAQAADNKVRTLETIVTKCTDRGDHSIVIDGEIWMCGATPTGIKVWQ